MFCSPESASIWEWSSGEMVALSGVVIRFPIGSPDTIARPAPARGKQIRRNTPESFPSLHPTLDPNRCISIGACATACPEGEIIGLVNGRAELIEPNKCIGHGACAAACG